MLDCRGVQELYNNSASFLASGKPFVTVGPMMKTYSFGNMFYSVVLMAKNALLSALPTYLGGVGRKYVQVAAFTNLEVLERLAKLFDDGVLKTPIDSSWKMEDALQVCTCTNYCEM